MKKFFGDYVSLCKTEDFYKDLYDYAASNNAGFRIGYVKYLDQESLAEEKLKALNSQKMLDYLFFKGDKFQEEQEFRVVFNKTSDYKSNVLDLKKPLRVIEEVVTIDGMIKYLTKNQIETIKPPTK